MRIEQARWEDVPLIQQLGYQTFEETYTSILTPEQFLFIKDLMYSDESMHNQINIKGNKYFIAYTDDDEVCGFVSIGKLESNRFILDKIYLLAQFHRKGLGRELIDFACNYATSNSEQEKTFLTLYVNRGNKSHLFYRHLGFEVEDVVDFEVGNGFYRNDYIMTKCIDKCI